MSELTITRTVADVTRDIRIKTGQFLMDAIDIGRLLFEAKASLDRVCTRMRKNGDSSPKHMFEIIEYLERKLDSAESELEEARAKSLFSGEVAQGMRPDKIELKSVLKEIKRNGWKPISVSVTESGVEIFLE